MSAAMVECQLLLIIVISFAYFAEKATYECIQVMKIEDCIFTMTTEERFKFFLSYEDGHFPCDIAIGFIISALLSMFDYFIRGIEYQPKMIEKTVMLIVNFILLFYIYEIIIVDFESSKNNLLYATYGFLFIRAILIVCA